MSQIKIPSLAFGLLLSLLVFSLSGCGNKNSQADLNPVSGKHPATWLPADHKAAAKAHPENCTECHGVDFTGGISKVACTQCHLGNQNQVHPILWGQFAYALHASYVRQNGNSSCANMSCHGTDLTGVTGSGPSCTSCHMGGVDSVHPLPTWSSQFSLHAAYVGQNGTSSCRTAVCHGANLQGVFLSGPACNACHSFISKQAGSGDSSQP